MKKLLIILLFLINNLSFSQVQVVNVGVNPNDHTGDPLRTAFQKVNINTIATQDSFAIHRALYGNIYIKSQTRTLVHDSLNAVRDSAINALTYFFTQADSNVHGGAVSYDGMVNYVASHGGGGGGSGGYEWTSWIVGTTTGAPGNGDTSYTVAPWAGYRIKISRGTDGDLNPQWLNETATNIKPGYRYNSSGVTVVRPAWATGDMAYLEAIPSGSATKIALTGGGGGSSLLTGLVAFWQLNESTGTIAHDVSDSESLYGVTAGGTLVNQAGRFGTAYDFDGTNDYVTIGTESSLRITGDFSVSVWIKTTMTGSYGGIISNYIARSGHIYGFAISLDPDGKIEAGVYYGDLTQNVLLSSTTVNNGAWHNIIFTYTSSTDVTNLYIDGGSSEDTDNTSGTITYHASNEFRIGDRGEGDLPYLDWIDCAGIWSKVFSSGERTVLQTYTHPFE